MLALHSYLEEAYAKTQAKARIKAELQPVLSASLQRVSAAVVSGSVVLSPASKVLKGKIAKMQRKPQVSYEEQLREHRLKEAMRLKQELEEKLYFVEDKIHVLADRPENDEAKKARASDKQARRQQFELEEKKRLESEEFARKLMEQQRELEHRRERQLAEIALQQQQSEAQAKLDAESLLRAQAAEREKRIEALRQKRFEREQQLAQAKVRMREPTVKASPERLNITVPEVEVKRPLRPPISIEEIEEHQKKYEERRKAEEERRRQKLAKSESMPHFPTSKVFLRVTEEERKAREDAERQAALRRQALEKQRQYAQLVRTTHLPAIDKKKAEESLSFLEPKAKKPQRSATPEASKSQSVIEVPKPKRPRAKPVETVETREEKKPAPDYLLELRKSHSTLLSAAAAKVKQLKAIDDGGLESLQTAEKLKERSSLVAEKVRRTEATLSRLDPTQPIAQQLEEDLNSALINSIKAKLSLLPPAK